MSTQSELLNTAKYNQTQAHKLLREAQKALDATPRSQNLAATQARDAAKRNADDADALVRQRQAEFDQANRR